MTAAEWRQARRPLPASCRILAAAALLLAVAQVPAAAAHGRSTLATPSSRPVRSCGHRALPRAQQDASQADLQLFNQRLAAAAANQRTAAVATTIVVPVYWHIFRGSTAVSAGNVPKARVTAQMKALNRYFAPAKFVFSVAKVTSYTNRSWFRMCPGSSVELSAKHSVKRGGLTSLNIYTGQCDPSLGGWSFTPDSFRYIPSALDGVVVSYDTLPGGPTRYYSMGKTLVHEVGHWLGLLHTFNPSYTASGRNLGGCVGPGDYVNDTPAEKSANFGGCSKTSPRNSCPEPKGVKPRLDPVSNFMDYSVDQCRFSFSKGQITRMRSMFNRYRASGTGYGRQGNNNSQRNAPSNAPAGGTPAGCSGCKCFAEGYCICTCGTDTRVVAAA